MRGWGSTLAVLCVLGVASGVAAEEYTLTVDAASELGPLDRFWQQSVGADHFYTVLGSAEGANAQSAYAMAAHELGMKTVRAHGILNDDVGIYSEVGGQPVYDFANYDQIMDYILSVGMKPLVELSFMPAELASGSATFGWYNGHPGNITPPNDYDHWQDLIYNIAKHSIERYGEAEVEAWYWEVWNEPDLADFFRGTQSEYLAMYDRAVAGLMQASPDLLVGGPSVAIIGSGWIPALIDHCMNEGVKLDFISWHKYPYPNDARPLDIGGGNEQVTGIIAQKKAQYPALDVKNFLTEWNSSFRGGDSFNNEMGASFVAKAVHGMFEDQSGVRPPDRAAFWVISDIWEEWDSRQSLAFDVMGLVMRKHDVRKPSYLAFQMLALMHDRRLAFGGGTSAEIGLNGFATLSNNGKGVTVLIYDHDHGDGEYADTVRDTVSLQLDNLPFAGGDVEVERLGVDRDHNNAFRAWDSAGRPTSPDEALWLEMKAEGQLAPIEAAATLPLENGSLTLHFEQQRPGVSLVRIREPGSDPYEDPEGDGDGGDGDGDGDGGTADAGDGDGDDDDDDGPTASDGPEGDVDGDGDGAGSESTELSGCACRAPGTSPASFTTWLPLALALVSFRRRRV